MNGFLLGALIGVLAALVGWVAGFLSAAYLIRAWNERNP